MYEGQMKIKDESDLRWDESMSLEGKHWNELPYSTVTDFCQFSPMFALFIFQENWNDKGYIIRFKMEVFECHT